MADYTTHQSSGGRWFIFGGLGLGIIVLLVALASGSNGTDPAVLPSDGTAPTEPALPAEPVIAD